MTWMMIVALAFCSPETCRGSCHPWRGGSSARWRENSNRTDTRGWRGGQPLLLQLLTNESTVWPFLTTQGPVLRSLWTEKYLRESSMQRRSISHSIKSYPAIKLLRLRKALNKCNIFYIRRWGDHDCSSLHFSKTWFKCAQKMVLKKNTLFGNQGGGVKPNVKMLHFFVKSSIRTLFKDSKY